MIIYLLYKDKGRSTMDNEYWLTINEYSQYRDISVSTIRRYIKNKSVVSKFENGKYLIKVSSEQYELRMKKKSSLQIQYEHTWNNWYHHQSLILWIILTGHT